VYQGFKILVSLCLLMTSGFAWAFHVTSIDRDANPVLSSGHAKAFSPLPYIKIIEKTAKELGLASELIYAVIEAESHFNPTAVSSQGALGLMQLMPSTAKQFGVINPFNPADNIRGGGQYLKYLSKLFKGDLAKMLAAYQCGHSRMLASGATIPKTGVTAEYVRKVLTTYYQEFNRRRSDSEISKNF